MFEPRVIDAWHDLDGEVVLTEPRWLKSRLVLLHVSHSKTSEVRRRVCVRRGDCLAVSDGTLLEVWLRSRQLCGGDH